MIGVDHSTNSTEFTALSGELIDAAHEAFNWAATGRAHPPSSPPVVAWRVAEIMRRA
jgi:hypothetical protein